MKTTKLSVQGMTCGHCVKAVTQALRSVPGVESVEVSLENKSATVSYDEAISREDDLRAAIEDEGYSIG